MIKYFTLIGLLCATSIKSQVFTWTARTDAQKICLYLSDSARISFKNGFPPYTYYYVLQHGTTLSGTTSDSAAIALQTQTPGIDTFVLQHVTDSKNVVHQINDTLYSTINDRLSINNTNLFDTICSNTSPRLVLTVCNCYNDTAGVTYEWADSLFNGHVKGYSPDTGSNVIDQVLINQSDSLLGTVVYYITPVSAAGCPSSYPTPFSITVKPSPVVTNTNLLNTVCSGAAIKIALSASTGAGATFSWTDSLVGSNISGGSAGSDKTSINQTLINSSNESPGSITYNVTALSAAGCVSASPIPITVLVNPLP